MTIFFGNMDIDMKVEMILAVKWITHAVEKEPYRKFRIGGTCIYFSMVFM